MQSHQRMLAILDLFAGEAHEWTVEEMHERLGYSRSTLYRYLKVLTDAGLLQSLPGMGYALGPRIIELDFHIRLHDPLVRSARPVMQGLVGQFVGVALLCRRYRQKVLCVHQENSTTAFRSNYVRGEARPLLRGAASLAILAGIGSRPLARLYRDMPEQFATSGLGNSLAEVKAVLKAHRQAGFVITSGQVTSGVSGVAAPIFDARDEVLGSLSLTVPAAQASDKRLQAIAEQIVFCASIISKSLAP